MPSIDGFKHIIDPDLPRWEMLGETSTLYCQSPEKDGVPRFVSFSLWVFYLPSDESATKFEFRVKEGLAGEEDSAEQIDVKDFYNLDDAAGWFADQVRSLVQLGYSIKWTPGAPAGNVG